MLGREGAFDVEASCLSEMDGSLDATVGAVELDVGARARDFHAEAGAAPAGFRATCERTTAPADVVLPVWAVGAAYLGGTRLKAMANAGLITEATPGSLAVLSTAMSWEPAPWCPMTF